MTRLRVAVVAHGRFHAFDLARELHRQGHDVTVLSNYPSWAVERFGIESGWYRGLTAHGVTERALARLLPRSLPGTEAARHQWFGRWATRVLEREEWDVVHCWSGISEELLTSKRLRAGARVLMRGSAHIAEQAALLREEESRIGRPVERPSAWMIGREQREYERADHIVVLSEFARASFERRGISADRLSVLPLGVDVEAFRAPEASVQVRVDRILSGRPLRVLYVGALSARKGLVDLLETARRCEGLPIEFALVGPWVSETESLLKGAAPNVVVRGSRRQADLPTEYWNADLFFFPTIEDGFGMVLTQAIAAGCPVLATGHCAAPDLVQAGAAGWVLPIRRPDAFETRIRWCHENRAELADVIRAHATTPVHIRSWHDVATEFAAAAPAWIEQRPLVEGKAT